MTDNLDNEIWKVYQTIPMHSSNPEDHIKPLRELMAEQLKQERNKAIEAIEYAIERLNDFDYKPDEYLNKVLESLKH